MVTTLNGNCLCGAVTVTATPAEDHMHICHCDMCRAWTGSGLIAFRVEPGKLDLTGPVQLGASPGGLAVRVVHRGDYTSTLLSYEQLFAWMAAHGYNEEGTSWEHYISDPATTPEAELETHIYFLVDDS